MGTRVALRHRTQYRYDKAVTLGPQVIQLRPTPHCRTPILSYSLEIVPADHILTWQLDAHANYLARVLFSSKATEFVVDVNLIADLEPINPFAFFLEPGYENFPFHYSHELERDLAPYRAVRQATSASPTMQMFMRRVPRSSVSTIGFLVALNQFVRDEIGYRTRLEHGVQTPEETIGLGTGSCRDTAWLLVQVCRQLGIAARFVSGYLVQLVPEAGASAGDGPKVDSADLHAWTEVFLPGAGWIGLDATSGLFAAEGHIPLVCTPDAAQAAPIGGTAERAAIDFSFSMSVRRLAEAPSLARPYSDEVWSAVRVVAHEIDRDLEANDVRLTMGGEPTFVGVDEVESAQWNLEALGPLKRTRGLALIRCLRERTAPGGLLHFGQGKWYPGEPLPRWAFHSISRIDGVPVWKDARWFADEDSTQAVQPDLAREFIQALSRRLEVEEQNILAAFEPAYDGQPIPDAQPTGYVLPLRRRQFEGRTYWSSQHWFEGKQRITLSPGDSPIGYRIPVPEMPWVAPDELVYEMDEAPYEDRPRLPDGPASRPGLFSVPASTDPLPALSSHAETARELIRPSLCVQVREGRLQVFLPYVAVFADYLDLVAAVEETCEHLRTPIWIEGYTPPFDPRMRTFSLTPDPGVLEVNLPPTGNWDELERVNEVLAEEAAKNRLIAAKFAYDGTHLATGGGSHIVIGGATLADSPLLRRPALLRSMVAFWQNHPSLSYMFSGMYVGPTSQYPRVDEARVDALYELEVSFSQLREEDCAPWILDGLFRNLLVDVTGNTHRAEFCIDKMFPPEGAGLRLGLLELRAFEMAPHYRMGLAAMLLVRGLVCALWKQPFRGQLERWGTALHDRYMLPHFVKRDLGDVLLYLRQAGYGFEDEWFQAHYEFRFPRIGAITVDGAELELRQALEPWNVLAEETTSGGMGRSVDSSLERIQVKLSGIVTDSRYVVACNGRRVPLRSTETHGEMVAGIRYRARKLSAALHPTIPVHTPLTFELIDLWREAIVGRCVYHATPPDGSLYTARPDDAAEAKERREKRFVVAPAPYGALRVPPAEVNPSFPMTLDMRWPAPEETSPDGPSGDEGEDRSR